MMKIALESMKQLSLSSPSYSNMKGGTPAKSHVMEKSLNQSLLNWNVVSNYFYTLLARILSAVKARLIIVGARPTASQLVACIVTSLSYQP